MHAEFGINTKRVSSGIENDSFFLVTLERKADWRNSNTDDDDDDDEEEEEEDEEDEEDDDDDDTVRTCDFYIIIYENIYGTVPCVPVCIWQ